MPSISPVQEQILENGMKEICTNTCDIPQWPAPPPNKYPSEGGELKAFVPIMNSLLSNGDSVVQTGLDGGATDYHTELGYSTAMSNEWENTHPRDWTANQVIDWLYSVFRRDYENVRIDNFRTITGKCLIHMKKNELFSLLHDDNHVERIYTELQQLLFSYDYIHPNQYGVLPTSMFTPATYESPDYSSYIPHPISDMCSVDITQRTYNQNTYPQYSSCDWYNPSRSDNESDNESAQSTFINSPFELPTRLPDDSQKPPHRRGPGRPPREGKKNKKNGQRSSRLWEFIRDLLKDKDTCPRLVKWEDRDEGVFRFVQSDQVAKLWGERKSNPRMTYEKLSRAMRTYYHNHILEPVPKNGKYPKKLVYKFGPNATGWQN